MEKSTPQPSRPYTREKKRPTELPSVYGKIPPQAKEAEEAVLGAIMLEREAFSRASAIMKQEGFYVEAHQIIFGAMERIASRSHPIDIHTVTDELRKAEALDLVGGEYYLTKLTNTVVSSAHIERHARIVMEKYLLREVIRIGGELVTEGYTDSSDPFELVESAEQEISNLLQNNIQKPFKSLSSLMVENFRDIEEMRHRDEHLTGVPSGFEDLDMVTCGWQKTDLVIVAARPSVGKTAFALNLARNAAMHGLKPTPVAFFSLEMNDRQLINRILAAESGLWLWKLRNARMEDHEMRQLLSKGMAPLGNAEIWIDDTQSISVSEFRSKARQLVNRHRVGMIIIDYLQLMSVAEIKNREQQISYISRQLKATAKELNVPIIALSQLSRAVEQRGSEKEPKLSDLRESGAIEQDADMVMFLWRPSDAEVAQDISLAGICNVKVEKNRNGDLARFLGAFQKEIQKWNSLKIVDGALKPIGSSWKPVGNIHYTDYTEGEKTSVTGTDEDMPF